MHQITTKKILTILLLTALLVLGVLSGAALAAGTADSDNASNVFVYAYDVEGKLVLLKVIPLDTLASISHGIDGTANTDYYASFLDSYPTPTYCEGQGVTIPELLEYVKENTSVTDADALDYTGADKLFFTCCDGAVISYTHDALFGTELNPVSRYYFPELYHNWDKTNGEVSDVNAVLSLKTPMPPYLATISEGGRVFASAGASNGGINLADYIAANNGVVDGCLKNELSDETALRFVVPQTESDIENEVKTYSDIKKWVYMIRLKEVATASPITSLGTVSDPTCSYSLDGDTLTITMSPDEADEGHAVSIYYSNIDGFTQTPLNLYTGPITVDDYDTGDPFTLNIIAVKEGYVNSNTVSADSADYVETGAPSFSYGLAASTAALELGTAFTVDATLTADEDYTLYGAEYRLIVPAAFTMDSVSAGSGWEYGTADSEDGATVVTFTYLDIAGVAQAADSDLPLGTLTLTPISAGNAVISVAEAMVTKHDATAYNDITADDLALTVPASNSVLYGDTNGDGSVTMLDVLRLAKHVAGMISLTGDQLAAADVNHDNSVTMLDTLRLAKYVAGIIASL